MSGTGSRVRPVRIVIRRIGITATSSLDAHRLADALPRALEGAFAPVGDGVTVGASSGARAAERVAAEVAAAVSARIWQRTPRVVPGKTP